MTEIRNVLSPGMKVVVSGQFLIDSEANLKTTGTRMAEASPPSTANEPTHHGEGRVEKVGTDSITLSHGPIPTLQWGAMTMEFKLPKEGAPAGVREGATVGFDFKPDGKGHFQIIAIAPKAAGAQK